MNNSYDEALKLIKDTEKIHIASHVSPDGDNIGSILAMALGLKTMGKEVHVVKTDEVPSDYLFLPGIDMISPFNGEGIELLITLDSADMERLGQFRSSAESAGKIINIDHHISNQRYGSYNIVEPDASSTGEVLFGVLNDLGIKIDKNMASCLYTAISTDTGSFQYQGVSDKTHEIAAALIRAGVDVPGINIKLYSSRSMIRTNLFIEAFSTMKTYRNDTIAVVKVTQDMLSKTKAAMEDTEGIISFIKEIDSIEVACLLKEKSPDEIKVSLRSKEEVNVSEICAEFNGGGHIRAAGCTINENIENAENMIVNQIINMW